MKNSFLKALLVTSALSVTVSTATPVLAGALADTHQSALEAQAEARAILNRAIVAAGGIEALKRAGDGKITLMSRVGGVGQGPSPSTGAGDVRLGNENRAVISRLGGRTAIENYNGDNLGFRYVRGDAEGDWAYLAGNNNVVAIEPLAGVGVLDRVQTSLHLLLEMDTRASSMRAGGDNVIIYADPLGRQQTVYFDPETGLPIKVQSLVAHAQWGDITDDINFSDYADMQGVRIAQKWHRVQAGRKNMETRITSFETDTALIDARVFEKPEGANEGAPITAPTASARDLTLEEIGTDIYLIANAAQGYNVIAVDQADGVLVLETPQTPQTARDILRAVKAKFPNKPIKAAVPTHHHFDHSGGIYGFLEAGVPIITTAGNADFIRSIGTASRSISGGSPAEKISVDTFTDRQIIGEGANRVELINVGPNPHVEEVIVAYMPAIKTLFVADLYSFRGQVTALNANGLAFADKLDSLKLDIEAFMPVHGERATAAQFEEAVKLARDAAAGDGR